LLKKESTGSDENPYCFRVYYVDGEPKLTVRSDSGEQVKPADATTVERWQHIRSNLIPYMTANERRPDDPKESTRKAIVRADRASLYLHPEPHSAGKMYLVKGDSVEILDRTKAAAGWYLVRYITKSGKAIEHWMRAEDLAGLGN
jgi:hypothetical protein